jgi:hypothetical protein
MKHTSFGRLLRRIHESEEGAITLETVLILGAIAIPVLLVIIKFGWPRIRTYFEKNLGDLENKADRAVQQ